MAHSRLQAALATGLALPLVIALSALPFLAAGLDRLPAAAGTFAELFGQGRLWRLLGRTLLLAGAATALATVLGTALGTLFGRTSLPGRHVLLLVHTLPAILPPFLVALGWFHVLGRQGLLGSAATSRWLFSPFGLVSIWATSFAPVVTWLALLGLRGVPRAQEEAARTVARPRRVFLGVSLPLASPWILAGALLVFALCLSDLGVPMFLRQRTYTAAVFTRLGGIHFAPGEALAMTLPLFGMALVLLAAERLAMPGRNPASLELAESSSPLFQRNAPTLAVGCLAIALAAGLGLTPVFGLAWRAGLKGLAEAWQTGRHSLLTSLWTAGLAASLLLPPGIVLGRQAARDRWTGRLADGLALLAFLAPSAVLGVGIVTLWNRPATQFLYAGPTVLVLGLAARYAFVPIRTTAALFGRSSPSLEEAAAAFGAGYFSRLGRILVPMHARGLVAVWLLTLLFGLRDLDTVVLFYPPGWESATIRIFTLEANGPLETVAGLALLHTCLCMVVLALFGLLLGRRRTQEPPSEAEP